MRISGTAHARMRAALTVISPSFSLLAALDMHCWWRCACVTPIASRVMLISCIPGAAHCHLVIIPAAGGARHTLLVALCSCDADRLAA